MKKLFSVLFIVSTVFTVLLVAAPQSEPSAKENATASLARILYIKLQIDFLQNKVNALSVTKQDLKYLKTTLYPRLIQTVDEDSANSQWNKEVKEKVNSLMKKIENNHQRYLQIKQLIEQDRIDEALKLSDKKTPQALLIAFMKEDDTNLTLLLFDKVDLAEDLYKQTWHYKTKRDEEVGRKTYIQNTPIVLSQKMRESGTILDALMTKDFLVENKKSASTLKKILQRYSQQQCIGDEDYERAKKIVTFLSKNQN